MEQEDRGTIEGLLCSLKVGLDTTRAGPLRQGVGYTRNPRISWRMEADGQDVPRRLYKRRLEINTNEE